MNLFIGGQTPAPHLSALFSALFVAFGNTLAARVTSGIVHAVTQSLQNSVTVACSRPRGAGAAAFTVQQ